MLDRPDAFLSYTRFDDRRGRITEFRTWLSDAVEEISGQPFEIFQDIDGIGIGERWRDALEKMLDQARFFIPILTPKFFNSRPCRDELTKFLELESQVGRQDLVLPIYWITCPVLEEDHLTAKDKLAQAISERQRWDWRQLRFEAFESMEAQRDLSGLASQVERSRRSVLRVVAASEAVGEHAISSPSRWPRPKLKSVRPEVKHPFASSSSPRTPFTIFRDIDQHWCPEMVMLPAGKFLMGSPDSEKGRDEDEGPQHEVTISHPFAISRFSVTFDEYDHFCRETGFDMPADEGWGRGRRPVINVSHNDAEAYCTWLSEMTDSRYRLPTEAQWEYACRAGTATRFCFGDEITTEQANFRGQDELGAPQKGVYRRQTIPVGSLAANPWGLHDMHGNTEEWCADGLRSYFKDAVVDPIGPADGECAIRGGSWLNDARFLRCAVRGASPPDHRDGALGFRCARTYQLRMG